MLQGDDALVFWLTFDAGFEFHIHGVGVADRDASLQPSKLDVPRSSKRIGTGFEPAKIIEH
jgi:hypothetical protein